jgi:hypothetical protein
LGERFKMTKTIFGFGVNDVDYIVKSKRYKILCPYYQKWSLMIQRCYSETYLKMRPSYRGCSVKHEWKYLSNFIKWVDEQPNRDWENCHLDKDILFEGNKVYSPETCVFISPKLNSFLLGIKSTQGDYPIGASFDKFRTLFVSHCRSPINSKAPVFLGRYATALEAHKAWQAKKHEYACQLADLQDDPRVAEALRQRYSPDKDWTKD